MNCRRAFTLVEMLSVVAVILILLVLSFPTIQHTTTLTSQVKCRANHRNISGTSIRYAMENHGVMTPPNWRAAEEAAWQQTGNGIGWLYENRMAGVPQARWVEGGIIFINSAGKMDLLRCPLEPQPQGGWTWWTNTWTTYCMNGAVCGYGEARPVPYRLSQFPPTGVLVWDSNDKLWNDGSSRPNEGLAYHHPDGAPYAAFNGSAPYISREDFSAELNEKPGRLWCNPGKPNGGP